jgi:hypothetical protein
MRKINTGPTLWPFSYEAGGHLLMLLAAFLAQTLTQGLLMMAAGMLFWFMHGVYLEESAEERVAQFKESR